MPDGVVEVLDDGHVDIRGGQAFQSLVGMQEQRRCGAGQHFVGMVVERDDRGLRTARVGLADEVLQEIRVTPVEPVEDADDREDRADLRAQALDPGDDLHQAVAPAVAVGATSTLSGASRPGPAGMAIATSAPSASRSR